MDIPKTMKAAIVVESDNGFHFTVQDVPVPSISPLQVLVRLSVSGVCGTDFALASGKIGPHNDILGHEGVGYVVKLGSAIDTSVDNIRIGDRVGVAWVRDICGSCTHCLSPGGETRCVKQFNSGRVGWPGTFAEYAVIPSRYIIRIPKVENVPGRAIIPDENLAPIMCGGVTAYKALKILKVTSGKWVAIIGAGGGVGAFAIQYAVAMGYRVIAMDIGTERESYCTEHLGAEVYIDVTKQVSNADLKSKIRIVTNSDYVSASIAAAGSSKAYEQGLLILAPYGTLVCVGIPAFDQVVKFHPLTFIDEGIRIIGSSVGTREDIQEAIKFVERGLVKPTVVLLDLEQLAALSRLDGINGKYVISFTRLTQNFHTIPTQY